MNRISKVIFLVFAIVAIFSVSSVRAQGGLSQKDIEAIKALQETYRKAWLRNDEVVVLSSFIDDAALYPNGAGIRGKAEIKKFWFGPSDTLTIINKFDDEIEEITGSGNFAAMTGTNTINWTSEKKDRSKQKRFVSRSTFITLLVRQNGKWKFARQMWNGETDEIK